jgi:hypothetical protein
LRIRNVLFVEVVAELHPGVLQESVLVRASQARPVRLDQLVLREFAQIVADASL